MPPLLKYRIRDTAVLWSYITSLVPTVPLMRSNVGASCIYIDIVTISMCFLQQNKPVLSALPPANTPNMRAHPVVNKHSDLSISALGSLTYNISFYIYRSVVGVTPGVLRCVCTTLDVRG